MHNLETQTSPHSAGVCLWTEKCIYHEMQDEDKCNLRPSSG